MANEFRADFLRHIIGSYILKMPTSVLVLGCGSGEENLNIKKIIRPNGLVIGVDIDLSSLKKNKDSAGFIQMDATALGFKDNSFDCIFSYHVLEHVEDYHKVLSEAKRILKPGDFFLLGTPNKRRLLGYINVDVALSKKIRWNIDDYLMKIRGKFENRYGAHAGFYAEELLSERKDYFRRTEDVTEKYFNLRYERYKDLITLIGNNRLRTFLFPSIYFLCLKNSF